jgi:lipopolysaccharide/colanic/teichoic acid biosynthesis glycosyltransferase
MKRLFDVACSVPALLLLLPFFLVVSILIKSESKGPVFYRQVRVGRYGRPFRIFKLRTMFTGSDKSGLITIGSSDKRITKTGLFLRKYKLDELPQFINVLMGDMSLVGPRPEVQQYVDLYTREQRKVLDIRPGITDYASLEYADENELLAGHADPERLYREVIMPAKLELNMKYIRESGFSTDLAIVFRTIRKIWSWG